MAALLPVNEALAQILSKSECLQATESLPLLAARGRVLVESQVSSCNVPPLDNSAMDGYALRFQDLSGDRPLPVSQRIAAGQVGVELRAGTAARIFTGAPIPPGADTVVMQEDANNEGSGITVSATVKAGQHIRPKGQDVAVGQPVVAAGKRLTAQDIGVLASVGIATVAVFKPLTVAVISTGDELVEPGQPLGEGQIYNSNRFLLSAMLGALGCEVVDGGIIADDFDATCGQLSALSAQADVLLCSGGVSVGEEDHVKAAVEALGELDLWKLNIKPGKPVAFGKVGGKPFFGLPGNPASSFVTFCLLARPYLLRAMGQAEVAPLTMQAKADFDWPRAATRQEYLRARVVNRDGEAWVERYSNQSSGVLLSTSWANALAVIPPNTTLARGEAVELVLLSEVLA